MRVSNSSYRNEVTHERYCYCEADVCRSSVSLMYVVRLRIIFSKAALQKRGSIEPMEPPLDLPLVQLRNCHFSSSFFLVKPTMFNNDISKTVEVLTVILSWNWCLIITAQNYTTTQHLHSYKFTLVDKAVHYETESTLHTRGNILSLYVLTESTISGPWRGFDPRPFSRFFSMAAT